MSVIMGRDCPGVDHYIRGGKTVYCTLCGQTWKHKHPTDHREAPTPTLGEPEAWKITNKVSGHTWIEDFEPQPGSGVREHPDLYSVVPLYRRAERAEGNEGNEGEKCIDGLPCDCDGGGRCERFTRERAEPDGALREELSLRANTHLLHIQGKGGHDDVVCGDECRTCIRDLAQQQFAEELLASAPQRAEDR